jgi:hypothetical protein
VTVNVKLHGRGKDFEVSRYSTRTQQQNGHTGPTAILWKPQDKEKATTAESNTSSNAPIKNVTMSLNLDV